MKFKTLPILLLMIGLITANLKLYAQLKIEKRNVLVKPFQFFGDDTTKINFKTKFPKLVLSGIEVNSNLQYVEGKDLNSDTKYRPKIADSLYLLKNKKLIDSCNISFFMDGEFRVIGQSFSVVINLRKYGKVIAEFESPFKPFPSMQFIVDSACNYFNYTVKNSYTKAGTVKVSVKDFKILKDLTMAQQPPNNAIDPDFPSRYLVTNLKNTTSYLLLPFIDTGKTDLIISGQIIYGTRESCTIRPVIYLNKSDSVGLQVVKGYLTKKDELLVNTLKNVQSSLDAIVIQENLIEIKTFIAQSNHSQKDYINGFDKAFKAGKLELAYFYADRLSENFKKEKNNSELLKSKIYITQDNLYDGLNTLNLYATNNNDDVEAKYYLGVGYLKNGNYSQAKNILLKLTTGNMNKFSDLNYQIGLCNFYLGTYQHALEYFAKQLNTGEPITNEIYLYIAYCYRGMKGWEDGLKNINKFYLADTSKNKNQVSNYLIEYAQNRFFAKDYKKAVDFYGRSYNLNSRKATLLAQLRAATFTDSSAYYVNSIIKEGLAKNFFAKQNIYLDVAAIYDATAVSDTAYTFDKQKLHLAINYTLLDAKINQKDFTTLNSYLGGQYFKLNNADSAMFYYNKVYGPFGYLNIAEFYVANGNISEALKSLKKLNDKYKLTESQNPDKSKDQLIVLYYYYTIGCKTINNEDPSADVAFMNKIIKTYKDSGIQVLHDWRFLTYYIAIKENKLLSLEIKKKLITYLCPLIPLSDDKSIPCNIN